jgi:TPR repeat protein
MRGLTKAVLAAVVVSLGIPIASAQNRPAPGEGLEAAAVRKYKTELRNIQELANRGDPDALFHLGLMHYEGWGVPQSYAEALKLFELAAERPHTQALLWLGDIYAEGKGVAKDDIEAHKYYDLAATQSAHGDLELSGLYRDMASKKRNDLASRMTSAQIAEAQKRAREWKPKGPLTGSALATQPKPK